jgi:hypothetical protein
VETEGVSGILFGDIVTAVLKDAFDDADKRSDAQQWVRARHAWVWDAKSWTFKRKSAAITFTANSQVATGPTDIHSVDRVYDQQGNRLRGYRDPFQFFDVYNDLASSASSSPEAYTVYDGQILIGPNGDGSTGLVLYEKAKPSLVNDNDPTGFPDGYDLMLVHGGKAEGFKLTNIPLAANFDADFTAYVTAMENNWLEEVSEAGGAQVGAFRPGQAFPAYR